MNQRMPRTAAAGLCAALVINGSLWLTVDSTNSALAAAEPAAAVETPAETPADEARLLDAVRHRFTVRAYEHGYDATPKPGIRQRICAIRTP